MRHRRSSWFRRRLIVGFAAALVVVPAAQAYPDEGSGSIQQAGQAVQGEIKDSLGATTSSVVIVGDDKQGLPGATSSLIVGDDKKNVQVGVNYEPTVAAEYNQYTNRRTLPQDLGPQAAIVAASDGFHWGDAGIGAGTAFAVLVLAGGALLLATRRVGHSAPV